MGFVGDLAKGQEGETWVRSLFAKNNLYTYDSNDKKVDFWVSFRPKTRKYSVECKNDLMSGKTGNLAIEWLNPNKIIGTGVFSSDIDLWCHIAYNPNPILLINSINSLIEFVSQNKACRYITRAGDGNSSIYLISIERALNEGMFIKGDTKLKSKIRCLLDE